MNKAITANGGSDCRALSGLSFRRHLLHLEGGVQVEEMLVCGRLLEAGHLFVPWGKCVHDHQCLHCSGGFWWKSHPPPEFPPTALNRQGYSLLEQPLFLRMSSGVVPKTNLTFCSAPCGQRSQITRVEL